MKELKFIDFSVEVENELIEENLLDEAINDIVEFAQSQDVFIGFTKYEIKD